MNIEQEFKEIRELLLESFNADYEDTLNQAIDKLDNLIIIYNTNTKSNR